jgi:hypothetical protein
MATVPNSGRNARVTAGPLAASDVRRCKDMDSSTVDCRRARKTNSRARQLQLPTVRRWEAG